MAAADPLRRELLSEAFITPLPHLLRYADRSSMAHSREVRLPLLDRRVAEFAYSLPAAFLYRDGASKAILRRALAGTVPDRILARRDKVGFEPPQAQWLCQPEFRERICDVLLDPVARARGLYDSGVIETDARAGRWRDSDAIWRALNAELWLRSLVQSDRTGIPEASRAAGPSTGW
jgi:asparagine synthetase B (glutamine-hydrolysing)